MLPHTDPPGRQVHISHGTLIEMAAIAATSLGYHTEIDVLPDGEISIPEFGTKQTATIRMMPEPGIEADPLFSQILERRSSRLAHHVPPLADQERASIEDDAHFPGVEVSWIPAAIAGDSLQRPNSTRTHIVTWPRADVDQARHQLLGIAVDGYKALQRIRRVRNVVPGSGGSSDIEPARNSRNAAWFRAFQVS